jgi:hypothetical protein
MTRFNEHVNVQNICVISTVLLYDLLKYVNGMGPRFVFNSQESDKF